VIVTGDLLLLEKILNGRRASISGTEGVGNVNACNIYISKQVYYESIFNDLSNDTNYVL
jgi:hypothetical protein